MSGSDLDLLVIGTGVAGLTIAHACAEAGWQVAVVDKRPYGGTCALRGCDPKKVLVEATHAAERTARLHGRGVAGDARVAWRELMAFKRGFTEPVPEAREKSLAQAGIRKLHGVARFVSSDELDVAGERVAPRHVAIAAGAKPRPLGIPGEEHVSTSTEFLDLDELPRRIAFIGGGYISMEFAHIARIAGADVTVLHRGERVLKPFDADLARSLEEATRGMGVDLRLRTEVRAIERADDGLRVHARTNDGRESLVVADLVVHGAGRVPEIDGLELAKAGVATSRRGVRVDEHLRSTTNPRVYAAGDAADAGWPLTPVAALQGQTVAHNLLHPDARRQVDTRGVASVAFTMPPLARVGATEEEAREAGSRFRAHHHDMASWATSRRLGERVAGAKVLVEEETGRILGAHILGEHAEDVVNLFGLAIRHGLSADELKAAPFAYPTRSGDVKYMLG